MRLDREHSSSTTSSADLIIGLFYIGPFFDNDDGDGNDGTGAKDDESLCLRRSGARGLLQDAASIQLS